MGRAYAGVLGPLAFCMAVGRGLVHAAGAQATLWWSVQALFVFAAIGYVVGELAGWIVQDSVRTSLTDERARRQAAVPPVAAPKQP